MKIIEGERFGEERALYRSQDICVRRCRFEGEEDGESALKECRRIAVEGCFMDLRYPLWHVHGLRVTDTEMTENCRAALWYDTDVQLRGCRMNGIKALRECRRASVFGCTVHSPEFGWRCADVQVKDSSIEAEEYAFFETQGLRAENVTFTGKYSFQYTQDVRISRSRLQTKDAFWHAKDVTVADSVLNGEYLGWYSEGLTLIRCHIKGTQPLCYCKDLKLIDCTMEDCDLAFEYSDVEAEVRGGILSVKNPRSGRIVADRIGKVIRTADSVYPSEGVVIERGRI